jgi:hypothetical protein
MWSYLGGYIASNTISFEVQDMQSLLETAVQNIIAEKWSGYTYCVRPRGKDYCGSWVVGHHCLKIFIPKSISSGNEYNEEGEDSMLDLQHKHASKYS